MKATPAYAASWWQQWKMPKDLKASTKLSWGSWTVCAQRHFCYEPVVGRSMCVRVCAYVCVCVCVCVCVGMCGQVCVCDRGRLCDEQAFGELWTVCLHDFHPWDIFCGWGLCLCLPSPNLVWLYFLCMPVKVYPHERLPEQWSKTMYHWVRFSFDRG